MITVSGVTFSMTILSISTTTTQVGPRLLNNFMSDDPHIAVIVGMRMALASVGVLIYFIKHIPESIHVSNIIAKVGRGLNSHIEKQFQACRDLNRNKI